MDSKQTSMLKAETNVPTEITFTAKQTHPDPFNSIILDVTFTDPTGHTFKVPAFWDGGTTWKVRYASPLTGKHTWHSVCNSTSDSGLHGIEGTVEIKKYKGTNPLYKHGPIRVAADKRHFEYADGKPFFWLGDTWWMGLCHRMKFPEDIQTLATDRIKKGFTVIQIVAGLYPDMHPFDPRGANEAGFPWEENYTGIRPQYWDAADKRIEFLIDKGLSPCIVGAWGYFLPWMGVEKLQAHWRYLIGRYGAYPVTWCTAGEANLPWYLAKGFPYDDREQAKGWTEVTRYIRNNDPYRRPLTIHPTAINYYTARHAGTEPELLDFDMLQTPHGQKEAVPITVKAVRDSMQATPVMPVINGEAAYEMLSDSLPTQWTRAMFWLCMMNGAKGHTYGANGIWQVNRKDQPHGASPHGGNYGKISWDEAMVLGGSQHMGYGKKFFEALPWTELVPMPETVAWESSTASTQPGDWIWFPEGDPKTDAPVASRYFRKVINVANKGNIISARLAATADDRFTVWVNGKEVGSGAGWTTLQEFNVTSHLRKGANVIAIKAENMKAPVTLNPAGLSAVLELTLKDGTKQTYKSDSSWKVSQSEVPGWDGAEFDDSKWESALVTAKYGEGPWGKLVGGEDPLFAPQACGIGDRLRAVYIIAARPIVVKALKPSTDYNLTLFDPVTGSRSKKGAVHTDKNGEWHGVPPTHGHDYVVLLEKL